MKVICKSNAAKNLDLNEVKVICTNDTYFPVTKGVEYIVMGIAVYKNSNCIYYLIDEFDLPCWLPYPLFEISHKELSPNWYIDVIDKKKFDGNVFCLSGFYELCNDEDYHDALAERELYALDIYSKRKYEVQEWYFEKG
jgi:hypothetical protein